MVKSAREKLAVKKEKKIVTMDKSVWGLKPGQKLVVLTPQIVDAYVKEIPVGETKTIDDLKSEMAALENCDATCPLSTAIFVRMVAEAALEDLKDGKPVAEVSPFWRLIDGQHKISQKIDVDCQWIDEQRASEIAT